MSLSSSGTHRTFAVVILTALAAGLIQLTTIASATDSPALVRVEGGALAAPQLLVRYEPGSAGARRAILRADLGLVETGRQAIPGVEVLDVPSGDIEAAAAAVAAMPGVAWAEPNYAYRLQAIPNDPKLSDLWALEDGPGIDALSAWSVTSGSPDVVIAVVDSGMDMTHPDLAPNRWTNAAESAGTPGVDDDANGFVDDINGWDFTTDDGDPTDTLGHGTHVAGTAAAAGNDGFGIPGVAWKSRIMPLRVVGDLGYAYVSDVAAAFTYAANHGARVVNASLAGPGFSQTMLDAITAAPQTLFVVAAGNSSINVDAEPWYPCAYPSPNLVCVAATDQWGGLASFSNTGAIGVDLGAPGKRILSTWPGGGFAEMFGTSMATPHVAGAAALLMAAVPAASPTQVAAALIQGTKPVGSLAGATLSGGRLDLPAALVAIGAGTGDGDDGDDGDDPPPPDPTAPLDPADGEWVGSSPIFRWNPAALASIEVTGYQLMIDGQVDRWLDPSSTTARPSIPLGPGDHTWSLVAVDATGTETALGEAEIRVDGDAPASPRIKGAQRRSRARQAFPVRWTARDAGSGLALFEVRYRVRSAGHGFGGYRMWKRSVRRTAARFHGREGSTYCFSVSAFDRVGNGSSWSRPACTSIR